MTTSVSSDRENGISPATRMITRLSPEAGAEFKNLLKDLFRCSVCVLTNLATGVYLGASAAVGASSIVPALPAAVIAVAAFGVVGWQASGVAKSLKDLTEIANEGERVEVAEPTRPAQKPSAASRSRPAGAMA